MSRFLEDEVDAPRDLPSIGPCCGAIQASTSQSNISSNAPMGATLVPGAVTFEVPGPLAQVLRGKSMRCIQTLSGSLLLNVIKFFL